MRKEQSIKTDIIFLLSVFDILYLKFFETVIRVIYYYFFSLVKISFLILNIFEKKSL